MSALGERVLSINLRKPNDADANNIRHYLKKLLQLVWRENENFNGKRPFGNSSWEYDLYEPLARAGYIDATYDIEGNLEDCDTAKADEIIAEAISSL